MKNKKRIIAYLIACNHKFEVKKLDELNEIELMDLFTQQSKQRKVKKILNKISSLLK